MVCEDSEEEPRPGRAPGPAGERTPGRGGGLRGVYSYSSDTVEGPRAPAVKDGASLQPGGGRERESVCVYAPDEEFGSGAIRFIST